MPSNRSFFASIKEHGIMRWATWVCVVLAAGMVRADDAPAALSADEARDGFVLLFDGKSLDGWKGDTRGYQADSGLLVCKPGGRLWTEKQYSDFVFRFEFKLTPGANNGVGIRTPMEGDPAYVGMEIQILDDAAPKYARLAPYQYHGSIYGVVPAKRGALKPAGEWNSQEIRAEGSKIKITLNGEVIVDADLSKIEETIDKRPHPGLHNPSGYIGFLGHGDPLEFRNIRIKELK
jgi:hypothetical protein